MTTKLLAVDDSKTMRKVLEITFAGDKYDSTIVGSADEALGALHTLQPQIAVVDGALAGANGYELCKQIKADSPETRVLLLSSKQRPYDEAQGSAAGIDDHFDKPFDSTKFLDKVGQLSGGAPAAAPAAKAPAAAPPVQAAPPPRVAAAPAPQAPAPQAPAPQAPAPQAPAAPSPRPSTAQRPQAPPARVPADAPQAQAAPVVSKPAAVAAPAAAAVNGMQGKLQDMGLTNDQVQGVLSLSRDVLEQVVWEVVPALAETLIKEEISRLTSE